MLQIKTLYHEHVRWYGRAKVDARTPQKIFLDFVGGGEV